VNIVHRRRKTDDRAIVYGDDEVMSGIVQELSGRARVEGIVKDVRSNCSENGLVLSPEHLDCH